MSRRASPDPASLDCVVEVAVPPEAVFAAFFSRESLVHWWGAASSITTPRPLGIYAVEWPRSSESDPLLGPLGGALYGIVIDVRPGREFFLADAYWMPPEGDPIGPMALHVTFDPTVTGTRLRVHQSGCDDSPRWQRYYRVTGAHWTEALARLKDALEDEGKGKRGKS
jgi:uncharacterized protein YndB with AHSA1/START domain